MNYISVHQLDNEVFNTECSKTFISDSRIVPFCYGSWGAFTFRAEVKNEGSYVVYLQSPTRLHRVYKDSFILPYFTFTFTFICTVLQVREKRCTASGK